MAMSMESNETSRYTDVSNEPVERLLSPIKGYKNKPLLPLFEAIQPVSRSFNGIEDYVYTALYNCRNPADNLTQEESAAIHLYTMQFHGGPSLYQLLNQSLRNENREQLIPWFPFLNLFLTALQKLPPTKQNVWRGVKGVDLSSKYKTGEKIAWWGVSSCATNINVMKSNTFLGDEGLRTLFSINCINGKSVINHSYFKSNEEEVILMPGSYFKVMGEYSPAPQLYIIQLQEIIPPITFVQSSFPETTNINPSSIICQSQTQLQAAPDTHLHATLSTDSGTTSSIGSGATSSIDSRATSNTSKPDKRSTVGTRLRSIVGSMIDFSFFSSQLRNV